MDRRLLKDTNSELFLELAAKNANEFIRAKSRKPVEWVGKCGHRWVMSSRDRFDLGYGCHYCSGQKVLKGFNDFATTDPWVVSFWSPRNELGPDKVTRGSKKEVWIKYPNCGHERRFTPNHLVKISSVTCKECETIGVMHPLLKLQLFEDFPGFSSLRAESNKVVQWKRPGCGHVYSQAVVSYLKNKNCAVCSNLIVVAGVNDIGTRSPEITCDWSSLNDRKFIEFSFGSNFLAHWDCFNCGHSWRATINDRSRGHGCPKCVFKVSKGEKEMVLFVESLGYEVLSNDRSQLERKELDCFIPQLKKAIEFNGCYWHGRGFLASRGKNPNEENQNKFDLAKKSGIDLSFVWECQWKKNRSEIEAQLKAWLSGGKIEKILNDFSHQECLTENRTPEVKSFFKI